jgi:STE24 endopeptidase
VVQWNSLLIAFLAVFILSAVVRSILRWLNIRHLARFGGTVPRVFSGEIDDKTLVAMRDYTLALSRIGTLELIVDDLVLLIFLLSGFLPWLAGLGMMSGPYPVLSGILFFFICSIMLGVIEIPFDLYRTFVIEKKFNFSTMTFSLWLKDLIKSVLLSGIIMGILLSAILALIYSLPRFWWIPAWAVFVLFQLLMTYLYPVLIAPLFNKFDPIEDQDLIMRINVLMQRTGFRFGGLFKMDASMRSRHTNAYFTGIGKTKRIVLFDTLLNTHTHEEIASVLAHELGHMKKGHVRKQIIASIVLSLAGFYLTSLFINWPLMYQTMGFTQVIPFAGLVLLSLIATPFSFFLIPIGSIISRRFERQADLFAYDLTGTARPMIQALKRLAKDNLSNLHPHPLYAWFYYSHPPLVERVETLEKIEGAHLA